MDSLPKELLMRVHDYAAPVAPPVLMQTGGHLTLGSMRRNMAWVADLRRVCRRWRTVLDDPKALVWYFAAKEMGLDPPFQLYSGGTHLDVCKLLVEVEEQRQAAKEEAARAPHPHVACGIRFPPTGHEAHPNPGRPVVELPKELVDRVAANAKALKEFLKSVDFSLLAGGEHERWHESALNRYKMFLYLKQRNPNVWLVPTADIEFCWLSHIFRTASYWKDVAELGIDPDHWLCLSYGEAAMYSTAVEATRALWDKTFGPSYPYLLPGTDTSWNVWRVESRDIFERPRACRKDPRRFFPGMGPEILVAPDNMVLPTVQLTVSQVQADLKWFPELQNAFNEMNWNSYDVLRGTDRDNTRLYTQQILPSYERFLNLCNQQKGTGVESFSPPYVLDLIWHAHQMEPHRYKEDCLVLFGREFWHDPWPHGLGVSTAMTQEFECAWKQAYGTPIAEDWKFYLGKEEW